MQVIELRPPVTLELSIHDDNERAEFMFRNLVCYKVKQVNGVLYLRAVHSFQHSSTQGTEGATALSYLAARHRTVLWNGNTPLTSIPTQVCHANSNAVTTIYTLYSWRDSQLHRH